MWDTPSIDTGAVIRILRGGGEPHEVVRQLHVQAIAMPVHGESQPGPTGGGGAGESAGRRASG